MACDSRYTRATSWLLLGMLSCATWLSGATPPPTSVDCGSIQSTILARAVDYCVDLPADYASSPGRYPTLYFLHGLFENDRSWDERGGHEIFDNLIDQGKIGKFIVVLPDADNTFYVNSLNGKDRYEDFFIQEFVPAIDHKYRTIPDRASRGIAGVSMGGYGSLHLGMRHSDVFGSASAQSAALVPKFPNPIPTEGRFGFYARILRGAFGSPLNEQYWDQNNPLTLAEHPESFAGLKLYFDCGDHDRYGFNEGAQLLDHILTEKHFPHEFVLRPGGHGWDYLAQYLQYPLMFHWRLFQQTDHTTAAREGKAGKAP